MESYDFFTLDDMRTQFDNKGRKIITILMKLYPDMFRGIWSRITILHEPEYNYELSGLYVMYVNKKMVCVCVIYECKINNIFTLPNYRRKGYALKMLQKLKDVKGPFSFLSPVEPTIVPLFLKAGWTIYPQKPNHDGTIDMIANRLIFNNNGMWLLQWWE